MFISYWNKAYSMVQKVRDAIFEKTGTRILLSNKYPAVAINYGRSDKFSQHNDGSFVNLCVNKLRFSQHLRGKNIVDCPEFNTGTPAVFPCLVRDDLCGFSGHGIKVYATRAEYDADVNKGRWHTPFVKCSKEYRVHVLGGKFVKVYEKKPINAEAEFPIRNSYNEYHYAIINDFHSWRKLLEVQDKLQDVLTGSFYALDIGWDPESRRYFIFEANSAPGLTNNSAGMYAEYLIDQLGIVRRSNGIRGTEAATDGGGHN